MKRKVHRRKKSNYEYKNGGMKNIIFMTALQFSYGKLVTYIDGCGCVNS